MAVKVRVISLGAGVQSTTLALMAAHAEITPMPDAAIFADTQWEPKAVYDHLAWLRSLVLPFPIYIQTGGNLRQAVETRINTTGGSFAAVPWHIELPNGEKTMGRRQCTKEYKLYPIRRKVRQMLDGKTPKGGAELWIGISLDEVYRSKPSSVAYITNRWPLIELRMSRNDCLRWLELKGYPMPPKSSCIGCPFHSDRQWRDLRNNSPTEWQDAIEMDRVIRDQAGSRGKQFMHPSMRPLDQVDLSTPEDHGQLNLFNNECLGLCST